MLTLNTKIEQLTRIGKTVSGRLKKLDILNAEDLIYYFPFRYEDYSKVVPIAKLAPYENVTILSTIDLIKNRRSFKTRKFITEALVSDDSGKLKVVWFNQPYLTKVLFPGQKIYLSGKMDANYGEWQFTNPIYEKYSLDTVNTARIVPIYNLTENLTGKQLRFLVKQVIPLVHSLPEWIPQKLLLDNALMPLGWSLQHIHFPDSRTHLEKAIRRLKFNELLLQQLKVQYSKMQIKKSIAKPLIFQKEQIQGFVRSLPFSLTHDQKVAAWQILQDIGKRQPMNRLLEGDVGSGKTVVAIISLLNVALEGKQSVFMAPTEVLAFQNYDRVMHFLKPYNFQIALMTRSKALLNQEKIVKRALHQKIKKGEVHVVVGTHALISERVYFKEISLAVIDEQHRFGVEQRRLVKEKSLEKKCSPHFLSMTATPIPRSLALILYGDLDISIIREMPHGRKKVITKIVLSYNRNKAYDFIRGRIHHGEVAFVVCPLIDPSDKLGVKSVMEEYEKLRIDIFPEIPIGVLHGKMKPKEKEEIMEKFRRGEIKILVTTSVIEVGVDIPNATIMMIEGAERFGLAQLYQFRGRVGRSHLQSFCFLFAESQSQKTQDRLRALIEAKDSFDLAQKDLDLRGPGDIFGQDQSGFLDFKIAQITDVDIIQEAKLCAEYIMHLDLSMYLELNSMIQSTIESVHME